VALVARRLATAEQIDENQFFALENELVRESAGGV
jgi:hypothetical protein